jgi:hypothetical protein
MAQGIGLLHMPSGLRAELPNRPSGTMSDKRLCDVTVRLATSFGVDSGRAVSHA